jgi:hypothetical protein
MARARSLCERNQSAFRGRGPAETDEQCSKHVPVSLPVVSASAYHYWEREAIVRAQRPVSSGKRRKIAMTSGLWMAAADERAEARRAC